MLWGVARKFRILRNEKNISCFKLFFAFYLKFSDSFSKIAHESFSLAVGFWPAWCTPPVFEAKFVGEISELMTLE